MVDPPGPLDIPDEEVDPEQGRQSHFVPPELIELHELIELRDAGEGGG